MQSTTLEFRIHLINFKTSFPSLLFGTLELLIVNSTSGGAIIICNLVQTLGILSSHSSIYGDGVKRIVLLLHYLMKRINRPQFLPEAETKWRCELLRQINLFRQYILPGMIQNIYMNYSGVQFKLSNFIFY